MAATPDAVSASRALTRPRRSTLVVAVLLAVVVVVGGALRLNVAATPKGQPSADQRAYVRIAQDLRSRGTYGDGGLHQPFHWAPGAPALFAVADVLSGNPASEPLDQGAARRAEAVVGTLTVLAVFALGALLAGPWAGLVAAAAAASYPPLIDASRVLVSEPLGALAITVALAMLVWAWQRGGAVRFALAGLAFGFACLVRADLLLAAVVLPLVAGGLIWRRESFSAAARPAGAMLAATFVVTGLWTWHASSVAGHFVPITDGGAGTLFVATYLPGHGTISGMKKALKPELIKAHPNLRHVPTWGIPAQTYLELVSKHRHPHLTVEAALRREVLRNLRVYALGHPLSFGSMVLGKFWRMWGAYYHGAVHGAVAWKLWWHRLLVALALVGALLGLWRSRSVGIGLVLLAIAITTIVDVGFVAEPRHAFRLLPALFAAGAAGWALVLPAFVSRWRPSAAAAAASPPASRSAG